MRKNQRATRRVGISTALRQRANRANHVWSSDIIQVQTEAGSTLRVLKSDCSQLRTAKRDVEDAYLLNGLQLLNHMAEGLVSTNPIAKIL